MSASNIIGNRNSTPETSTSNLRPPSSRAPMPGGHQLRASADMGAFSATSHSSRNANRPASEVIYNQMQRNQQRSSQEDALDQDTQKWIADIDQYETTLDEMAAATLDQDFKDELRAIEDWFRVLTEAERTAALYSLLQQTTQVQIKFFIGVLQQMSQKHPMSGVLSPANFGEKDAMSNRLSSAMSNKFGADGNRNSLGLNRAAQTPGAKRNSGLDPDEINSMFPDAAAAIAKQKEAFTQQTGTAPTSNRSSAAIGDRSSIGMPVIAAPRDDGKKDVTAPVPPSPWRQRSTDLTTNRPKSSSGQQPMGQFSQPPPSAGLRSPRKLPITGDNNIQNTTLNAPDNNLPGLSMFSPYAPGASWASMANTPMVSNFSQQQPANQADMVANATAMKLAALETVNNRVQLDDARKYRTDRRARSTEGEKFGAQPGMNSGLPGVGPMRNELGQILTPQQAAALQAQQLAAMGGARSRPTSPARGFSSGLGAPGMSIAPQANGYLSVYDANPGMLNTNMGMAGLNLGGGGGGGQFGVPGGEGYGSDASEINRGRSPRGRRGTSKPPEDPTDLELLKDIPAWLRSLRLHKYTDNLKDMDWQELIQLDDAGLEKRGVNALGARRKMLKVFDQVREAQTQGRI